MYKHIGYVWPGMKRIPYEEAKEIVKSGGAVFRLYDNNAEGEVSDLSELTDEYPYGIEYCGCFTFEDYFSSNANEKGQILFSHGTEDVKDLLALAVDFFEVTKVTQGEDRQSALAVVEKCIETGIKHMKEPELSGLWLLSQMCIDAMIPDGWQFGRLEGGIDYGFTKK